MKTLRFIGILILILGTSSLAFGIHGVDEVGGTGPFPFDASVFENLDYGIYWFGDNYENQKAKAGKSNPYFDPNKPTLIFVHGWQKDTTKRYYREAFNFVADGAPSIYYAEDWIRDGWNVGVFYWNQMADEFDVKNAEAKIWSASGPKRMRWRTPDDKYHDGPSKPASLLFYEAYRDAMQTYQGNEIRIVGHSLGNQMAIVMTKFISMAIDNNEIPGHLLPTRVALLDAFYSNYPKDYLDGRWTGEVARQYVIELRVEGVIFESYRTSSASGALLIGDENKDLHKMCAFTEIKPWYFNSIQFGYKHVCAIWHYFWSYSFSPPSIKRSSDTGASASASNERIEELMNSSKKLVHDLGVWSKTPKDDRFVYKSR